MTKTENRPIKRSQPNREGQKIDRLIAEYNSQENLENLTAQTAFEFLKDPKGYLEQPYHFRIRLDREKPEPSGSRQHS